MSHQNNKVKKPLWVPSPGRIQSAWMTAFRREAAQKLKITLENWNDLYRWSITHTDQFWFFASEFLKIKWHQKPVQAFQAGSLMRTSRWFPSATLNFAENVLPPPGPKEVLVAYAEGGTRKSWSSLQLWNDVARCAASLKKKGVGPGDLVAGVLINGPEAIIAMLGASSVGAIWSSCSPDFGVKGIADRLSQVKPKLVFASVSYQYGGKFIQSIGQTEEALRLSHLDVPVIAVDHFRRSQDGFELFLQESGLDSSSQKTLPLEFVPRSFQDPQYVLFSSGTTGLPKCIVHGVGGTLLQHKKELMLHCDLGSQDKLLYFTTCGWMMWNWMVSALSCGATVVTFDGNPGFPSPENLWNLCEKESVTHFGTSPKFIAASMQAQLTPKQGALKSILSTGSPLLPAHFEWVYEKFSDIHLASISGGTDIVSCFMLGNPTRPVYSGEIQGAGLGMAIEAWSSDRKPVYGEQGELVCVKPFPSMPVGFWNDPTGAAFHKAYFSYFADQDVWRHGDFIEMTLEGGVTVYGRSDATLNPGGVRIGTAELYRVVEEISEVLDAIAVGQRMDDDTRIILFVKLHSKTSWSEDLSTKIKTKIRKDLSPRHVPALIIPVEDIPYTRSGKKVEIAVTQVIHGEAVTNRDSLVNPESLDLFQGILK